MKYQTQPFSCAYAFLKKDEPDSVDLSRYADLVKDIRLVFKKGKTPKSCIFRVFSYSEEITSFEKNIKLNERPEALSLEEFFKEKECETPVLPKLAEDTELFVADFEHLKGENSIPLLAIPYNEFRCWVNCENYDDFLGVYVEYIYLEEDDRRFVARNKLEFNANNKEWSYNHGVVRMPVSIS